MSRLFDLHTHTSFSDGRGEVAETIAQASEAGLEVVAITDHFGEPLPHRMETAEFLKQKEQIKALAPHPIKVVHGVEAGIETVFPTEITEKLDLVIRSVHYFRKEPPQPRGVFDGEYWEFYKNEVLDLMNTSPCDVVGHIEGYLPLPLQGTKTTFDERRNLEKQVAKRFFDQEWQMEVARRALRNDIAIEIHAGSRTPRLDFLALCKKTGCLFSVSSDAHAPEAIGNVQWGFDVVDELCIPNKKLLPYFKKWMDLQ